MRSHDKNLFGGHIRLHGGLQGLSEVLKAHFSASWSRQLPGTNQDAEFIQHVTQGVFIYHKSVDECFRLNSIDPQTTAPFLKASMNTQDWRLTMFVVSLPLGHPKTSYFHIFEDQRTLKTASYLDDCKVHHIIGT